MQTEDIKQTLQDAMQTGEILSVIYYGGSDPGTARMIFPVKIDNAGVWAKCIASNRVKRFLFEKMRLPESGEQAPVYHDGQKAKPFDNAASVEHSGNNLFPVFMTMLEQFEALEQKHIQTSLHPTGVELHQCFQNGKPQAIPFFCLEYEANQRPPWVIYGLSKPVFMETSEAALIELLRLANS